MGGGRCTNLELRFNRTWPHAQTIFPVRHSPQRAGTGGQAKEAPLTARSGRKRPVGQENRPLYAARSGRALARRCRRTAARGLAWCRTPAMPGPTAPSRSRQIAASIREWGWTVPVLVDEQSNIIAGHGRVLAAQRLGLTEVPVMVARGWSEAQKQAYVIADNKLALNAGWDEDLLRIELGELKGLGADLGLTGFGELELDALFAGANDGGPDPDEAPERAGRSSQPARRPLDSAVSIACCAVMPRFWPTSRRCWAANWPTCASPIRLTA